MYDTYVYYQGILGSEIVFGIVISKYEAVATTTKTGIRNQFIYQVSPNRCVINIFLMDIK